MKNRLLSGLSFLFLVSGMLIGCGGGGETSLTPTSSEPATSQEGTTSEETTVEPSSEEVPVNDNKVHLIVLAGQSGARGKGDKTELTADQSMTNEDVYIYEDGHTMAYIEGNMDSEPEGDLDSPCKPGYGDSVNEIGPEVGIAETFRSRYHDEDDYKAIIVKYTVCGTDFPNHWYSDSMVNDAVIGPTLNKDARHLRTFGDKQMGPLTRDLYQLLTNCIADLEADNLEVEIDGFAWVHGEMDAQNHDYVANYEKSLEYFINDFRDQFGEDIPVVVTSVLTNAAGYRNELLEAQYNVSEKLEGVTLLNTDNLYANSFEPWHFSAQSNMILGNEIAAEFLERKDNRVIQSLNLNEDNIIDVPYGYTVTLPQYLPFIYEDDFTGMSKVHYVDIYNMDTLGLQELNFEVRNINGVIYEGKLKVNVCYNPFIDGHVTEADLWNKIEQNNDELLELYYALDENGVYLAGVIQDQNIWSDSEQWKIGDMGQKDRNDDVRFFITGSDVEHRVTACISAANMFRIYKEGRSMNEAVANLQLDNFFYRRTYNDIDYRATIHGTANDNTIESYCWEFELFISYEDLGIAKNAESFKLLVLHSDINNPDNISGKTTTPRTGGTGAETYICAQASEETYYEEDINTYLTIQLRA